MYEEQFCKEAAEGHRKLGRKDEDDDDNSAVAPEGVLLKKQYLKPILTAVC